MVPSLLRRAAARLSLGALSAQIVLGSFVSGLPVFTPSAYAASVTTLASASMSATTAGGTYTPLTGPVITESATADIGVGTIILNAPTGFEFDTGGTAPTVKILKIGGTGNSKNNNINNETSGTNAAITSRTTSQITFTVTAPTESDVTNSLTWQNVRVRPTAAVATSCNITNSGTSTITGVAASTNMGTLTETLPTCNSLSATIFVTDANKIVGGPDNGSTFVATLNGTAGNDVMILPGGTNTLNGNGGDDTACGTGSNETFVMGAGNDYVSTGDGGNSVTAGAGTNTIVLGNGNDTVTAGAGDDTVTDTGGGNDVNVAGGTNSVTTGNGNDIITTGDGNDTINAGDGGNTITAGNGLNLITSGNGNDTITSGTSSDTIVAGDGTNSVTDTGGDNSVTAGNGNDTINTAGGDDTISVGDGTNNITDAGGNNVVTTGNGNDNLTTGAGNDVIVLGNGTNGTVGDRIQSGAGNDSIVGGNGNDQFDGGDGQDYCNTGTSGTDSTINCEAVGSQGIIIIAKDTTPDSPGTSFAFTGDLGAFSVDGEDSQVFVETASVGGVSYDVIESALGGWTLDSIVCSTDTGTSVNLGTSTATVGLHTGDIVTCTFANSQAPQTATTTDLVSDNNPSAFGEDVTFTATVTGDSPTGTVQFYNGVDPLGSPVALSAGEAELTIDSLAVGTHTITAEYSGDGGNLGSTSNEVDQEVEKVATTTDLASDNNPSEFGETVNLTATVTGENPTGTVTFYDDGDQIGSPVPVSAGEAVLTISTLAVGSHPITAEYSGDGNNEGSTSDELSQVVDKVTTTTDLASDNNPSEFGEDVTFTATVTGDSPTGTVQFFNGVDPLGSPVALSAGEAELTIDSLAIGTHPITATYNGDGNNAESDSNEVSQVVDKVTTTLDLVSDIDPSAVGETVTFTATVTGLSPTGTVTFKHGSTIYGTGALVSGVATLQISDLPAGTNPVQAVYGGDDTNDTSEDTYVQNVEEGATITAATGGSAIPSTSVGGAWTALTGPIISEEDPGQVHTGTITLTLPAGFEFDTGGTAPTVLVTRTQGGGPDNKNINELPSGTAAAITSITSTTVSFTITDESNGGVNNSLTFQNLRVRPTAVTPLASGNITMTSGSIDGVTGSTNFGTLIEVENVETSTTTLESSLNPSVVGASVTFTATVTGFEPTGTVTFYDNGSDISGPVALTGTSATFTTSSLTLGTHPITAEYSGDGNNTGSTSEVLQQEVVDDVVITTNSNLPKGTVDEAYSEQLSATGGVLPYVWTQSGGTLPDGLTLGTDGLLSGTPTVDGDFDFTVIVTDDQGNTDTREFSLRIKSAGNGELKLEKSGPGVTYRLDTPTYTLTVTNEGNNAATHVEVVDTIPTGFSYVSTGVEDPCEVDGATVVCSTHKIESEESETFDLEFEVSETADCNEESIEGLVNTATVSADQPDPNLDNNTDEVAIHVLCSASDAADLVLTKSGAGTATPGSEIEYTLTVTNANEAAAANVVLTDPIPEGLSYTGTVEGCAVDGDDVVCTGFTLGEPILLTFAIDEEISCGAIVTNTATVTGDYELVTSNNTDDAQTIVDCIPETDLAVTKSGPETVLTGNTITYTITATNFGPDNASGVTVSDHFPTGLTFTGGTEGCVLNGSTIDCETELAFNESKIFTLNFVRVEAPECTLAVVENYATVDSLNIDENETNNTSSTVNTELTCPEPTLETTDTDTVDEDTGNPSNHRGHRTNEIGAHIFGGLNRRFPNGGFGGRRIPGGGFGGSEVEDGISTVQQEMICQLKKQLTRLEPRPTDALVHWAADKLGENIDLDGDLVYEKIVDADFCS